MKKQWYCPHELLTHACVHRAIGSRAGRFSTWWGEDPHQCLLWGVHQTWFFMLSVWCIKWYSCDFPPFQWLPRLLGQRARHYLAAAVINSYFRKNNTASVLWFRAPTHLGISYTPVASGMLSTVKYLQQKGFKSWFPASWGNNCREDGDSRYPASCLLGGTCLPTSPSRCRDANCEWKEALLCVDTVSQTPPKLSLGILAAWIHFFCAQLCLWSMGRMLESVWMCEVEKLERKGKIQ